MAGHAVHLHVGHQLECAGSPLWPYWNCAGRESGRDWATGGLLATKLVASGEHGGGEAFLAPSQVEGLHQLDIRGQAGQGAMGGHVARLHHAGLQRQHHEAAGTPGHVDLRDQRGRVARHYRAIIAEIRQVQVQLLRGHGPVLGQDGRVVRTAHLPAADGV